jgi:GH15 family glucan-1,4-alpha-glucosidase
MSTLPIEDYALLSDCHTAALVSRHGSVDWLCLPRFDSPAIFGRLLDDGAGHWSIRPAGDVVEIERRYRPRSLVLETTFHTDTGTVVLTDALAVGADERGHDLGAEAPHALLRRVECTRGEVEIVTELSPRPEYGLVHPLFRQFEDGCLGQGGASVFRLSGPGEVQVRDSTVRSRLVLEADESVAFAFQHRSSSDRRPEGWTQAEIEDRIADTLEAWTSWSEIHQSYQGPWRDLVHHSGRVLQGLTYYPTGAIVAAPTTSLPETPGGSRNWDYRYTWVRDASFTLDALWVAACPDEAHKFFDFMAAAALTQIRHAGELQIMFGIGGEHDLTERELPHLRGWRDSAPVRIGNGAWDQRQLDVYGELLDAAWRLREYVEDFDPLTRQLLPDLADAAADQWTEQDQGIWEVRGPPRDYLYSKLMCWVAVDRALRMTDLFDAEDRVERWESVRDEIRSAILDRGWSEEAQAFTQSFGSQELDASSLMMPIVGFIDGADPRMLATLRATEDRLTDHHGLVYRYRGADGLEGEEGTFLLCTFWLAEAWALAGELERAREVFERAVACANDVGLLAEEVDPGSGSFLGNYPQAFSHIGLVNAAWAIGEAEGTVSAPE